MCEHEFTFDTDEVVCEICGEVQDTSFSSIIKEVSYIDKCRVIPRTHVGELTNFINIINLRSGRQSLKIKNKKLDLVRDVVIHLYGNNYNERKVKDVLKKLKLYKHANCNSYLIFCILKKLPCLKFEMYEPYFEYIYTKLFNLYITIYKKNKRKYFISSSFILSKLLYEVGIIESVDHCFKNISTFETHNNIYDNLRKQIPMNYTSFTTAGSGRSSRK